MGIVTVNNTGKEREVVYIESNMSEDNVILYFFKITTTFNGFVLEQYDTTLKTKQSIINEAGESYFRERYRAIKKQSGCKEVFITNELLEALCGCVR